MVDFAIYAKLIFIRNNVHNFNSRVVKLRPKLSYGTLIAACAFYDDQTIAVAMVYFAFFCTIGVLPYSETVCSPFRLTINRLLSVGRSNSVLLYYIVYATKLLVSRKVGHAGACVLGDLLIFYPKVDIFFSLRDAFKLSCLIPECLHAGIIGVDPSRFIHGPI